MKFNLTGRCCSAYITHVPPLPEETDPQLHLRPPGVLSAIRYLGGLVERKGSTRPANTKLLEHLVTLLNDHLHLEGEVIRLAGIVRRSNKLEKEKWSYLYPFGQPKREEAEVAEPKPWDARVGKRYYTCVQCHKIKPYFDRDADSYDSNYGNQIVSVDGKPYCKDCLKEATKS